MTSDVEASAEPTNSPEVQPANDLVVEVALGDPSSHLVLSAGWLTLLGGCFFNYCNGRIRGALGVGRDRGGVLSRGGGGGAGRMLSLSYK
jgi:hypothetical protein